MATYAGQPSSFYSATGGVPKTGAWYSSRQAWQDPGGNWTLSQPGQINPLSNQQGAGQAVSQEVIAQTNPANVAYINQQRQSAGLSPAPQTAPQTTQQVTSFLNDYQTGLMEGGGPETRGVQSTSNILTDVKESGLFPDAAPPLTDLVEQYGALKEEAGVGAIQGSITDLKSQQDAIASQLQVTKTAERGKPVAQNVIEGRVSQEQQTAQDQYDFIGRQLSRKQEELNSALGNIQMIMQYSQTNYQNASAAYNTQFDHAISTINLVRGIQNDQKDDVQRAQDNARANAQIMVNMITSGNLSLSSLPPQEQAQLNKLEVQAGLPVGFFSAIRMDADANIISTNTNEGITQVVMRNGDGTISVQSYGTRISSGGSKESQKKSDYSEMNQILTIMGGSDKVVSGAQWSEARGDWAQAGYDVKDFDAAFQKYTNRKWDTYAGL